MTASSDIARHAGRIVAAVLLIAAIFILWHEFRGLTPAVLAEEFLAWGPGKVAAALALTAFSFLLLAVLDGLAFRDLPARPPLNAILFGGFAANGFGHALGFSLLTGSAVRAKVYGPYGVSLVDAAQVTAFSGAAFAFGVAAFGGLALTADPAGASAAMHIEEGWARAAGILLLVVPVAYVGMCAVWRGNLTIRGRVFALPSGWVAAAQVVVGLVDNIVTAAVVWVLLPKGAIGFVAFAGPYIVASMVGLISHVPGGAGVFEGLMLTLLPDLPRAGLAAAFVGYRLFYFLAPLALAALFMARPRRGRA